MLLRMLDKRLPRSGSHEAPASIAVRVMAATTELAVLGLRAAWRPEQPPHPLFTADPPAGECTNPYTCRLLMRIDAALARARGRHVGWSPSGTLCEIMPAGHGVELRSIFPDRLFVIAADVQNRWRWTRKVLSR